MFESLILNEMRFNTHILSQIKLNKTTKHKTNHIDLNKINQTKK